MKENFKIDYISLTAAHFTTFPQPEQSRKIARNNLHDLADRAQNVRQDIGNRAKARALEQLKGGKVNVYG
ncbi:MAG: hypothetical protein HY885_15875 [Deltaproteobacteria bacterium]|nr:hypothetical protein [Deltaproteobacteria bacterium]